MFGIILTALLLDVINTVLMLLKLYKTQVYVNTSAKCLAFYILKHLH